MKYWELQSSIKQKGPAPIYLVVGEEDYLRDQALALIKSVVLGEAGSDGFNYDLFYGGEHPMTDVLACAAEIPVFAERRLVVLKWAEKVSPREGEILLPYLRAPCDTTTLVLLTVKLDRRMKFSQALSQRAAVVECEPPKEGQLAAWVREEAGRLGVRLQNEAIAMLKETAAGSLYSARRELEKLAAYLPSGAVASPSDVEALRGTEPGASVFDLTAAIGARDPARVLGILARNLEAGEAPLRILGSLVWQYRRLWKMKELTRQGGRDGEAARNLRMEPYKVRAFLGQFPEAHLRSAFESFLETDSKLKGGSAGSGGRILETLVLGLCERGQRVRSEH